MSVSSFSKSVLVIVTCLVLAGCKSDAERADEYFQSGLELLESGDVERAMVQFRNVFEFDSGHLDTRETMAKHYISTGNTRAAYGQYLAIAERNPEHFESRLVLAELAFVAANWDEFERHGASAVTMQPENQRVQAVDLGLKYRSAVLAEDDPARQALVAPAENLLAGLPDNRILNNLLVDSYARDGSLNKSLERIDVLLSADPDDRQLYNRRLALLTQMQALPEIETQLQDMVEQFPGDNEVQGMLLRYYVSQKRMDEAETFLRSIADPSDADAGLFLTLIQFVSQTHGTDAARVEIERAIAENPNPDRFKAMLALLDFQAGEQEASVAKMETILSEADLTDPTTQNIQTMLARMLVTTGNQVGARRLVEEVLAQNPSHIEGLKMQADWQLKADEVDAAIANLRVALDTSPDDIQVMNMMYEAYTRAGETDLARDFLAQAVETSGNSPETSLRYARLLIGEERFRPAEDVLLPALRQAPRNIDLLAQLGQLYLRMDDMPRATQVIDTLRRMDTDRALTIANRLQAESLSREGGNDEALAFLENLAASETAGLRDQLTLLQARVQVGETEEALKMAQELVSANPENLGLKQVLARTQMAAADLEGAEATFRALTEAAPQAPQPWLQLARVTQRAGDTEKSESVIEEALEATNNNPNILWAKASVLERKGDIDGAITIYEDLYKQNSASVVVANNLASLLSTYKEDEESLERAWIVGRRLQGTENPALQDTYGWLLFRRGDAEAALPYLESAAAGLTGDPIVQAHLGLAYAALERNDEALEQMQKAVDIAGPADTRSRIEQARAEVTRLRALNEN